MAEDRSREASVWAGTSAGLAGFATFLLIHHLWIVPIWFITPVGGIVAALGGAMVGVAYAELLPYLPRRRAWRAVAVAGSVVVVLLPAFIIGEIRGPIMSMGANGGGSLLVSGAEAAATFVLGLLGSATVMGAGLGLLITRRRRAAVAMAAAAFVFALGPGHNIPFLGGTSASTKEVLILAAVVAVSSVALVEGHAWLMRRPARAEPPSVKS